MINKERMNKKRERFKRIAEKRTQKILKTLDLLGNCSNKSNYEYTQKEVDKIFSAIEKKLKVTKNRFEIRQNKDKEFKL